MYKQMGRTRRMILIILAALVGVFAAINLIRFGIPHIAIIPIGGIIAWLQMNCFNKLWYHYQDKKTGGIK